MADTHETGKEAKKGGGLVGVILVTLLAAGGGAGFGFFLFNNLSAQPDAATVDAKKASAGEQGEHGAEEKKEEPKISKLVPLTPIIVNLASPPDTFLRLEATVVIEDMEKGADILAAQVGGDITAYLKTATLAQIDGPSGYQNLREDLLDRAQIRDREHIKDLVIHGIVLE